MKTGIIIDQLDSSQKSLELIQSLNQLNLLDDYIDVCVFYKEFGISPIYEKFAVMHEEKLWGFNGIAISTSISTTISLIHAKIPKKKLFYVWDLEWMHNQYDFKSICNIYNNPSISLIARNEYHKEAITKAWKEPKYILESFNYEQLAKIINTESK